MDELVPDLRKSLSTEENEALSDFDCKKFLIARKGNINGAIKLAHDWCKWRNTEILGLISVFQLTRIFISFV